MGGSQARRCLALSSGSCRERRRGEGEGCLRVAPGGSCECSAELQSCGESRETDNFLLGVTGKGGWRTFISQGVQPWSWRCRGMMVMGMMRVMMSRSGRTQRNGGRRREGLLLPAVPSSCGNAGTTSPPPKGPLLTDHQARGHPWGQSSLCRASPRSPYHHQHFQPQEP